jgi:hypothetical protein
MVAWMLNYLAHVARAHLGMTDGVPSRDHLLNLIDLDAEGRRQTAKMLSALPSEFPNVIGWF